MMVQLESHMTDQAYIDDQFSVRGGTRVRAALTVSSTFCQILHSYFI